MDLQLSGVLPSALNDTLSARNTKKKNLEVTYVTVASMGVPQAQCACSATIWASGRTRDPYFEILGAPRGIMVTPSGGFDF